MHLHSGASSSKQLYEVNRPRAVPHFTGELPAHGEERCLAEGHTAHQRQIRGNKSSLMTPVQSAFRLPPLPQAGQVSISPITLNRDVSGGLAPAPSSTAKFFQPACSEIQKEEHFIPKCPFPHIPRSGRARARKEKLGELANHKETRTK